MFPGVRRGRWRPGLPQDVSGFLLLLFTALLWIRGVDYATGDRSNVTDNLSVVERAMPLPWWGALFLLAAVMVSAGMALRREQFLVWGSVLAMALYGGLTWGLTLKMVERGWPWDGFRTPVQFLALAVVWGAIAYGTRVMTLARAPEGEADG